MKKSTTNGLIVLGLILFLVPAYGFAEVYHYIDLDGVERWSNNPPPEGATIIGTDKEIEYDETADRNQQKTNQEAASDYIEQNTPSEPASPQPSSTPPPSSENTTNVYIDSDDDGVNYHRKQHRRKRVDKR